MLKLIKTYNTFFDLHKADGMFKKLFFGFMLALPHILTCLILILFFPEQWIEILIVGLILPDLSYFLHMLIHPAEALKGNLNLKKIGENRKKVAHLLTFVVITFLLLSREYILFLAGGIHLVLDMLGF